MEFEGYFESASDEFLALEKKLKPNLDRDLDLFKDDIKDMIESEIIQRYYYKAGTIRHQLRDDKVLEKALEILNDRELYNFTLQENEEGIPPASEIKEKIKEQYS